MNVRLSKDQKGKILDSEDLWKIMQQVLLRENKIRRNQEHFWVAGLDNKNKLLFIELIALGAVNRVGADPADVFRMGIYKLAVKMVLVHNHPSGTTDLSKADMDFTDRMIKSGKILNIDVVDHLVITENSYVSFEDKGLMAELRRSGMYEVVQREQESLKQIKLQMEFERGEHQKALSIAKKLKEMGNDEATIKKITGLKLKDIREL